MATVGQPSASRVSTGAVEGKVCKLKAIKRQMYGRANFDLLRLRVILAQ
jgi:transposase